MHILETPRLLLRELVPDDIDFVAEMLAHPEVMRFWPKAYSRPEAEQWIATHRERYARHGHSYWLMLAKDTGAPVGQAGLLMQQIGSDMAPGIGYLVHRPFWGRGYATEAGHACLDHAFRIRRYPRVICLVRPENVISRRVTEKLGFQFGPIIPYANFDHIMYSQEPPMSLTADEKIRPARPADLEAIVAMRDRLNEHELVGCAHASIRKLTLAQFTEMWATTLADADYCWRVVEAADRVVGYGLIYLTKPRTTPPGAFVHWAYLEPEFRRHGIGERMVSELLTWAKERGADRIELQYIDGNENAANFWTKMGFTPYARKAVRYL